MPVQLRAGSADSFFRCAGRRDSSTEASGVEGNGLLAVGDWGTSRARPSCAFSKNTSEAERPAHSRRCGAGGSCLRAGRRCSGRTPGYVFGAQAIRDRPSGMRARSVLWHRTGDSRLRRCTTRRQGLRAAGGAVTVPSFRVVAPCASPDRPAPPAGALRGQIRGLRTASCLGGPESRRPRVRSGRLPSLSLTQRASRPRGRLRPAVQ